MGGLHLPRAAAAPPRPPQVRLAPVGFAQLRLLDLRIQRRGTSVGHTPPRPPPLHLSRLPTHTIATRNKPHAIAPTLSYSTLNSLDTLGGSRRTCSVPYDLSDLSDEFAHLSNHCIQTKSDNYGWAGRQHHHCVRSDLEPTRQHQHQYRHQHPTLTSAHLTRP